MLKNKELYLYKILHIVKKQSSSWWNNRIEVRKEYRRDAYVSRTIVPSEAYQAYIFQFIVQTEAAIFALFVLEYD